MQFRKPSAVLAVLGAAVCLLPAVHGQQASHPPAASTQSSSAATPPTASGSTSDTTTVVPPAPPSKSDPSAIHVSVNEVIVPVTVTDDRGRFVSDLDKKDFQVFEENKPQNIRYFTRDRNQPVVIGFLLDMSTASRIHWKNFQNATEELDTEPHDRRPQVLRLPHYVRPGG